MKLLKNFDAYKHVMPQTKLSHYDSKFAKLPVEVQIFQKPIVVFICAGRFEDARKNFNGEWI